MTFTCDPHERWGVPMDTLEQFRGFAEECERLAEEVASNEQQRSALKEMAAAWRKVAEEYDQTSPRGRGPGPKLAIR